MVIDQAKVNRLCILMLHRLRVSKVSEGCVSSFVPCTSPPPKPSPPPLFNLHIYFKRGWRTEGGGETPQYFKRVQNISALSPAAAAEGAQHHPLSHQKWVYMQERGGGRRCSRGAQRV